MEENYIDCGILQGYESIPGFKDMEEKVAGF